MANIFASTSLAQSLTILKNWYAGPIVSQFNDELPWYKAIDKGAEKFSGLQVVRALKVRRNQSVGSTSDGGTLPAIGAQTTVNPTIQAKFNYLRFGLTGPMLKASQGEKGAFASIMDYEMKEGLNDLKTDVNRQFFWDGSGTIATLSAAAAATATITVYGRESTEEGNRYLDVGSVVDVVPSGTSTPSIVGLTVLSVTGSGTVTVVLSSPITASSGDLLVRSGSAGNDIQGLVYTLDGLTTGSRYGIDRAVYSSYIANATNNGGGQLTLNAMQTPYNEARRLGSAKVDAVYCDFNSERFYNRLLIADKRYSSSSGSKIPGDGTFSDIKGSYLEWAGVPVVADKDCPQRFFFLDSSSWRKYVLSELEWADETGSFMIAQTSADAFEVRLRLFANLFCEKPRANGVLSNYISP